MKRLLRILFKTFTTLSLLLCVTSVVLWVRSYRYWDLTGREGEIRFGDPQWGGSATSASGKFGFVLWKRWNPRSVPTPATGFEHRSFPALAAVAASAREVGQFYFLGLVYDRSESDPEGGRAVNPGAPPRVAAKQIIWSVIVPYWQIALLLAIAPVLSLWSATTKRRALRLTRGQCPICGYDLRATPDRCPECGTVSEGSSV